jgi:hypothetical protein
MKWIRRSTHHNLLMLCQKKLMKAQLNNFHHTLSHGLGVVKKCMKEGNDTTTTNVHTVKGAIDALVTKDDMQEISSSISTIMEKHIGAILSSSTTTKEKNNTCSGI